MDVPRVAWSAHWWALSWADMKVELLVLMLAFLWAVQLVAWLVEMKVVSSVERWGDE